MDRRITRTTLAFAVAVALAPAAEARITHIVIDSVETAINGGQVFGAAGTFDRIRGRAYGELDPSDPANTIIQDLDRAPRNARGNVEYNASFSMVKPTDMSKASGVLDYSVVNRGNGAAAGNVYGHVSLVSGWQGDLVQTANTQTLTVPVATNANGSPITGPVLARFWNATGSSNVMSNAFGGPNRYPPASLDTKRATLTYRTSERITDGVGSADVTVPGTDWAFADCRTVPFPGTPDPTRVCLRNGFDPTRIYTVVFQGKDPLVLGMGPAAVRDLVAFFRYGQADDAGTANPVAGEITHAVTRGTSQSGNFIKTFIHLGFNESEDGRLVFDGAWPFIAARQNPINFRFAIPGGAGGLYEPGSEPVLTWHNWPDKLRDRHPASLLDRCRRTNSCPKIFESFGATEFWGLRMSPGLIGTDAKQDVPLPPNVRRYYYPGVTHGGGGGGFALSTPVAGGCRLPSNPNPTSDQQNALFVAFVDWVVNGVEPPASRYPTLKDGLLVPATKASIGFPTIPFTGLGPTYPDNHILQVFDYDFGNQFIYNDMSGVITVQPPTFQVLPTYAVRVDADGNEIGGVPSVQHQAPLGTYLGWNIRATGFYAGQLCDFTGGWLPFRKTQAERIAAGDPRPSVEERYGSSEGYVCVVKKAADKAVAERFLLQADADRLVAQATAASVLPSNPSNPTAVALCTASAS